MKIPMGFIHSTIEGVPLVPNLGSIAGFHLSILGAPRGAYLIPWIIRRMIFEARRAAYAYVGARHKTYIKMLYKSESRRVEKWWHPFRRMTLESWMKPWSIDTLVVHRRYQGAQNIGILVIRVPLRKSLKPLE